jgi:hypothetical protein
MLEQRQHGRFFSIASCKLLLKQTDLYEYNIIILNPAVLFDTAKFYESIGRVSTVDVRGAVAPSSAPQQRENVVPAALASASHR